MGLSIQYICEYTICGISRGTRAIVILSLISLISGNFIQGQTTDSDEVIILSANAGNVISIDNGAIITIADPISITITSIGIDSNVSFSAGATIQTGAGPVIDMDPDINFSPSTGDVVFQTPISLTVSASSINANSSSDTGNSNIDDSHIVSDTSGNAVIAVSSGSASISNAGSSGNVTIVSSTDNIIASDTSGDSNAALTVATVTADLSGNTKDSSGSVTVSGTTLNYRMPFVQSTYARSFPFSNLDLERGTFGSLLKSSFLEQDARPSDHSQNKITVYSRLLSYAREGRNGDNLSASAGLLYEMPKYNSRIGLEFLREFEPGSNFLGMLDYDYHPWTNHRFKLHAKYYDYESEPITGFFIQYAEKAAGLSYACNLTRLLGDNEQAFQQIRVGLDYRNAINKNLLRLYDPDTDKTYLGAEGRRELDLVNLSIGYDLTAIDNWGETFITLQASELVHDKLTFSYSQLNTPNYPSPKIYKGRMQRIWYLPADWQAVMDMEIQLASNPVPSTEYFSLLSNGRVRARFTNETYSADQGKCASLEIRSPAKNWHWLDKLTGKVIEPSIIRWLAFYDFGQVEFEEKILGLPTKNEYESAGIGLRINRPGRLHLDLDVSRMVDTTNSREDKGYYSLRLSSTLMF